MNNFTFTLPILKAAEKEFIFFGRASSVALDKQGEAFTQSAIKAMGEALPVPLVTGRDHQATFVDPTAIIGTCYPTDNKNPCELIVRCALTPGDTRSSSLWWVLKHSPQELGLSVSGKVPVNARRSYGGHYEISDVVLDSIMLVRAKFAANPESTVWIDEVAKACIGAQYPDDRGVEHLLRDLSDRRNAAMQVGKAGSSDEDSWKTFLADNLRKRGA